MDASSMKKITLFIFWVLFFSVAKAQKVYFVYLQSENQQPFFARMGEKVYNSSGPGYLILSKLRDSTYLMNIGLQGSAEGDHPFSITVNKKDQGYLLKNFGEKGWGLFNLHTMAVLMPSVNSNPSIQVKTEKREANAFTDLLAKAADDSTLKEKPVIVMAEEKKTEAPPPAVEKKEEAKPEVKDTVAAKAEEIKKELPPEKKEDLKVEVKEPPVVKPEQAKQDEKPVEEIYRKSTVIRGAESSTTEGTAFTFFDQHPGGKTDTIRILIPDETKKLVPAPEIKPEEKRFLEIIQPDTLQKQNTGEVKDTLTKFAPPQEPPGPVIAKKNNCPQSATDDDFYKLRKKMAGESNDDNMISEAKRVFRIKCFTVQQLKNLSSLFLSDEGKYKFFDAAYSYVSDIANFSSLQNELKEEYYINRFKAMLR
jgi:hypothetical protein